MRCGSVVARGSRLGPDAAFAFSITGLAFALPSVLLPLISAGSLGNERTSLLFSGIQSLWLGGMRSMAILVFLCGWLIPLSLLTCLAVLCGARRMGWQAVGPLRLERLARTLGHWAIPEAQVLAVLVAIIKLGSVVNLTVGPGFWCYCLMAISLLLAQHSFIFDPAAESVRFGRSGESAT